MLFNVKLIITLALAAWCIGIFAGFVVPAQSGTAAAIPFLNLIYSHVCHQNPAKAIVYEGMHSLVCSRCSGIYSGALIISVIMLFFRMPGLARELKSAGGAYLLPGLIILPMAADVLLYNTGVYDYSKNAAFFTGLLSGSAGFLYILDAFQNFINEHKRKRDQ